MKDYHLKVTIVARGNTESSSFTANINSLKPANSLDLKYCNVSNGDKTATVILESPVGSGNFITYGCLCKMVSDSFIDICVLVCSLFTW